MKHLFFLFFLFVGVGYAQKTANFLPLTSYQPTDSFEDLKQIDSIFVGKSIIGLGESTHGTSEFVVLRHRIFKYLVENHEFNTFFLEADYAACQRVNRYIHGSDDNVDSATNKLLLWPWITSEMTSLIEWMRVYNFKNGNKLNFVGTDMQLAKDELPEFERLFSKRPEIIDKAIKIDSLLTGKLQFEKQNVNAALSIWKEICDDQQKNTSYDWLLTKRSLDQFFQSKEKFYYNFRDSCMAENIVYYKQLYPETKGIYFAHNIHVSKALSRRANFSDVKRTGTFLSERLGENYAAFALSTYEGEFNVLDYVGKQIKPTETSVLYRKFNISRSVEKAFSKTKYSMGYLNANYLKTNKLYSIVDIGAAIIRKNNYRAIKPTDFNGVFFLRTTTPTHLLINR
mgnify:CR=1 FL=1